MAYPSFNIFGTTIQITQFFGERPAVYAQFHMNGHNGVDMDFADKINRCLASGKINGIYFDPKGYGHYIRVTTDDGYEDTYGHFESITHLSVGQRIELGQKLDPEGMSGFATGKHLHYGRKPIVGRDQNNGYLGSIDPWPYLELVLTNQINQDTMTPEQEKKMDQNFQDIKNHLQVIEDLLRTDNKKAALEKVINMMTNTNGDNRLKVIGEKTEEILTIVSK